MLSVKTLTRTDNSIKPIRSVFCLTAGTKQQKHCKKTTTRPHKSNGNWQFITVCNCCLHNERSFLVRSSVPLAWVAQLLLVSYSMKAAVSIFLLLNKVPLTLIDNWLLSFFSSFGALLVFKHWRPPRRRYCGSFAAVCHSKYCSSNTRTPVHGVSHLTYFSYVLFLCFSLHV